MSRLTRVISAIGAGVIVLCTIVAANAQTDQTPTDPVIEQAARDKARSDALRAAAEADKAATDAQVARAMAAANALPKTEFGALEPGEGAGMAEARILNAIQMGEAAQIIVAEFCASAQCSTGATAAPIVVVAGRTRPTLSLARQYLVTVTRIDRALSQSQGELDAVEPKVACLRTTASVEACLSRSSDIQSDAGLVGAVAEASGALSLLARLGGMFARDISITGADLTGDDNLLAIAVANRLRVRGSTNVYLGGSWMGVAGDDLIASSMRPLLVKADAQRASLIRLQQAIDRLKRASASLQAGARKTAIDAAVADFEAVKAIVTAALAAHDGLATWLGTANQAGTAPIGQVTDELRLLAVLRQANASLLHVHVHNASSSAMSEQSLWTFLGSPPFSVAASAAVTMESVDPASGRTIGAAALVCDSDYTRMSRIHSRLRNTDLTVTPRPRAAADVSQCHRVTPSQMANE